MQKLKREEKHKAASYSEVQVESFRNCEQSVCA